jgi:ABC-type uncharacterized transport system permease subunit
VAWLALFTLIAYLILGFYFWHTRWHQTPAISVRQLRFEHVIVALILLIHACAVFPPILQSDHLDFGTAEALSVIAWVALMSYWLATFSVRLDGLQPILFFISALFMGLTFLLPTNYAVAVPATLFFKIHFTLAMLAYGLTLYAVWLALLIWIADRQLHLTRGKSLLNRLPSLLTLEKYLFDSIVIGFILLSLALITGFSFPTQGFGRVFYYSHKVIFSILAWFVFAILLWGRLHRGWRGRFAVNWVMVGFIFLIVGYIGSSIVLHVIL